MKIKLPRFFYRSVQSEANSIAEDCAKCGNAKSAIGRYLSTLADKMPAGMTVEKAAAAISDTAGQYCKHLAEHLTVEDVKARIQESVASMDEKQAFVFVATLEATFDACDRHAAQGDAIPVPEEFARRISDIVENPGEASLAERIDDLANSICGDTLKAAVFCTGKDQIVEMVEDGTFGDETRGMAAAALAQDGIEKADRYAFVAAAAYAKVLKGEVPGVTPEMANPEVIAILTSAGMEKAGILARFIRGEIDKELMLDLLEEVEVVAKFMLTLVFQACIWATGIAIMAAAAEFFGIVGAAAEIMISIGSFVGLMASVFSRETAKELAEVTVEIFEVGVHLVVEGTKVLWDWLTEGVRRMIGTTVPA